MTDKKDAGQFDWQETEQYRRIKTIVVEGIGKVMRLEAEKLVNDTIDKLTEEGHQVISIIPHNFGVQPISLMYDLMYEQNTGKSKLRRYIKTVIVTVDETKEKDGVISSENLVNAFCNKVYHEGGKVITILPHNYAMKPLLLLYDIIYEVESRIE